MSARRSATSPGRPLRAGGVYGRSSPVSLCSLRGPGSWCPGLGRLLASAALPRSAPGPGADYQRPSDHQNCRSLHSSASSRPTRLFQYYRQVLAAAVGVVCRRCCDGTASSARSSFDTTRAVPSLQPRNEAELALVCNVLRERMCFYITL